MRSGPTTSRGDTVAEQHDAVEVITTKRDGGRLSDSMVDWVVDAYTRGVVADEQMSALAMAILLNGMDRAEISRWTDAMIASGERMDFSGLSRPTSDKHSTGGVGDKITLPLAPLVAACGVAVPQLSGRGLGHTGGTLDKLESIPGFRTDLSLEAYAAQVAKLGCALIGQTRDLAPADRILYALRDVTGTVQSIPLIASSVMSKKIAGGAQAILRTSWVFSAHGANFVKTMLRLSETRDTLNVVSDQIGGPTPARAIAEACLTIAAQLAHDPGASGTYHFAGAPDTSWADFAREIFARAGRTTKVTPIPTTDYPTPARRPQNSRLDCRTTEAVFGIARPDWRRALTQTLTELDIPT